MFTPRAASAMMTKGIRMARKM
uniref:Uncharacterized protein n=1 Tax=Zea mays TaxID=4577 RepID=C4J823_MAIZE|nr:unknown [Zea mays]